MDGRNNKFIVILVNLIGLFFIFMITEYILYANSDENVPFITLVSNLHSRSTAEEYDELKKGYNDDLMKKHYKTHVAVPTYRQTTGINYSGNSVVLFGCSFAWGWLLKDNQTFSYKLSKFLKKPVYNRAIAGGGVQNMLWQLRRDDFYSDIPHPDYVIYVYIPCHIARMLKYGFLKENLFYIYRYNYLKYNERFGKLVEERRLQFLPYSRLYNWYILPYFALRTGRDQEKSYKLFKKHILECRYQIDKHWGQDTKFIILDYGINNGMPGHMDIFTDANINELANNRIYVIKTAQLSNIKLNSEQYLIPGDGHPNEKAWDLITPLFAKKLKDLGL